MITDNNPLTYVLTSAKLDAKGQRWIASLSGYNFSIKYRSGKKNFDADGLSRCKASPEEGKAILHSLSVTEDCPLVGSVAVSDSYSST